MSEDQEAIRAINNAIHCAKGNLMLGYAADALDELRALGYRRVVAGECVVKRALLIEAAYALELFIEDDDVVSKVAAYRCAGDLRQAASSGGEKT